MLFTQINRIFWAPRTNNAFTAIWILFNCYYILLSHFKESCCLLWNHGVNLKILNIKGIVTVDVFCAEYPY